MENRRSIRVSLMADLAYRVDGSMGVTIMKRVADLSEGGLFVDTPVPAEVGTVIEVRFHLDGQPIVATGRVAYAQPFIGMGVEFTHIEPEMRDHIRAFVARVTEPALV